MWQGSSKKKGWKWFGKATSEPPPKPSEAKAAEPNPPLQYLMIQGTTAGKRLRALEPPRVPVDLLVLDENQGLELEPYPAWSSIPPARERVDSRWPWPVLSSSLPAI